MRSPRPLWCGSALLVHPPSGWITGHDRDWSGGGKWVFEMRLPQHVCSRSRTLTRCFLVYLHIFSHLKSSGERLSAKNRTRHFVVCFSCVFRSSLKSWRVVWCRYIRHAHTYKSPLSQRTYIFPVCTVSVRLQQQGRPWGGTWGGGVSWCEDHVRLPVGARAPGNAVA